MPEAIESSATPQEILAEIQKGLHHTEADERLKSIEKLGTLNYSSEGVLHLLEKIALKDRSKKVRAAALSALGLPVHQQVFSKSTPLAKPTREILLKEMRAWVEEGLVDKELVEILEKRYAFDVDGTLSQRAEPAPRPRPVEKPKRSLGQVLFSESSIKIALYLGAFFIIAAASIFAAAIESLRLPILLIFTLFFGGASLGLKKKLPQPSFTLFIVFSILLIIDFNVIADMLGFKSLGNTVFWMSVFAFMTGVWGLATWFFRSRFFSLTAFITLGISLFHFADLFDSPPIDLYLLTLSLLSLVGIGAVKMLAKWQDENFSLPLLILAQIHEITLLAISFVTFLIQYDDATFGNAWWLVTTLIWVLGVFFYIFSDKFKENLFFRALAVLSLTPVLWLSLNTFDASESVQAISFLIWAICFILLGEVLDARKGDKANYYGQILLFVSIPLAVISASLGLGKSENLAFGLFLSVAILYFLLTLYRTRVWSWMLALIAVIAAYFIFFELYFARNWNLYLGLKFLLPSLLLLLPELFFSKPIEENTTWRLPPIELGTILLGVNSIIIFAAPRSDLWKASLIFGIYALLLLFYALRHFKWLAYISNIYFAISLVVYLLRYLEVERWLFPFIALSIFFYLLGWALEKRENTASWANIYRYSGLGLAIILSFSAPFEDSGLVTSIPVVLAAGLFTIEAFRKRNIWLGFPANGLYLLAYFMILANFEVEQPQLYSLVAAALGMLMHYLLVRSGSKTAAFITGMLSQLVLLSTTYFQLVAEEEFIYFVVLFFQALAVLIYGLVSRSKSLVITPIIFLVLSVITVTLGLLDGWPTIFLIGCTGVFLIAFGIGALLLREQVASLRDKLDDWNA